MFYAARRMARTTAEAAVGNVVASHQPICRAREGIRESVNGVRGEVRPLSCLDQDDVIPREARARCELLLGPTVLLSGSAHTIG